jgi:hypothetical protein
MRTISNAPRFWLGTARLGVLRLEVLGRGALVAVLQVLGDDFARGVFAATAAGSDGKLALHFEQ